MCGVCLLYSAGHAIDYRSLALADHLPVPVSLVRSLSKYARRISVRVEVPDGLCYTPIRPKSGAGGGRKSAVVLTLNQKDLCATSNPCRLRRSFAP
jgi:hypothetical protein